MNIDSLSFNLAKAPFLLRGRFDFTGAGISTPMEFMRLWVHVSPSFLLDLWLPPFPVELR